MVDAKSTINFLGEQHRLVCTQAYPPWVMSWIRAGAATALTTQALPAELEADPDLRHGIRKVSDSSA